MQSHHILKWQCMKSYSHIISFHIVSYSQCFYKEARDLSREILQKLTGLNQPSVPHSLHALLFIKEWLAWQRPCSPSGLLPNLECFSLKFLLDRVQHCFITIQYHFFSFTVTNTYQIESENSALQTQSELIKERFPWSISVAGSLKIC